MKCRTSFIFIGMISLSLGGTRARAAEKKEEKKPDKSAYNLFNPTPRDQMREFDADRPGATDSPHTLDAGHVQLEVGAFSYGRQSTDGVVEKIYNYGATELVAGLTGSVEAQLLFDGYTRLNTDGATASGTESTGTRIKWNLFGNEEGPVALGVIFAAHYPTGSREIASHRLEEGVNLPIEVELPFGWSLSFMPSWARNENADGGGFHNEFATGVVADHDLCAGFGAFGQMADVSSTEPGVGTAMLAGFGFTFKAAKDIQLDAGANFGLTQAADTIDVLTGFVIRY